VYHPAVPEPVPEPPGSKSGTAFFAVILLLYGALGSLAQWANPLLGLTWSQAFTLFLPALIAASGSNLEARHALLLARRPAPAALGLAVPIAAVAFFVAIAIQTLAAVAVPERWFEAFNPARLFDRPPLERAVLAVLATTLAPLVEELTFRGYLMTSLRTRHGPPAAIALSAFFFAVIHLDPVRFAPVLFLGALFGWLAWRSGSIWPAVVAHATNNGLGVLAADIARQGGAEEGLPGIGPTLRFALPVLALGAVALAGLAPFYRRATPHPPPVEEALVRRDPGDPSLRFRLRRVPARHLTAARIGLLCLAGLALLAHLRHG
jgi:membrane protease YdiL (CAAX protease family)